MRSGLNAARFPQLLDQARVSTGYTHAPGGRLKLPLGWGDMPRAETPAQRDIAIPSKPAAAKARRSKIRGDL